VNVKDIAGTFRLTYVLLRMPEGDCVARIGICDPSGWSSLKFRDGSLIHVSGPRTPVGQVLELVRAVKQTVRRLWTAGRRLKELGTKAVFLPCTTVLPPTLEDSEPSTDSAPFTSSSSAPSSSGPSTLHSRAPRSFGGRTGPTFVTSGGGSVELAFSPLSEDLRRPGSFYKARSTVLRRERVEEESRALAVDGREKFL